jgi:thiamine pyrophosphate-dependent acetolactate synthase large subunit-like protein
VLRNGEYCILKSFAELEETPGVPGLDLPGIDIVSLAKGYGCDGARLDDLDAIKRAAAEAWTKSNPRSWRSPFPHRSHHSSNETAPLGAGLIRNSENETTDFTDDTD